MKVFNAASDWDNLQFGNFWHQIFSSFCMRRGCVHRNDPCEADQGLSCRIAQLSSVSFFLLARVSPQTATFTLSVCSVPVLPIMSSSLHPDNRLPVTLLLLLLPPCVVSPSCRGNGRMLHYQSSLLTVFSGFLQLKRTDSRSSLNTACSLGDSEADISIADG